MRHAVLLLLVALGGTAACTALPPVDPVAKPPLRPTGLVHPASNASQSLRIRLEKLQRDQIAFDQLRRDESSPETAHITARILARNFRDIAFHDEHGNAPGPQRLHRWETPVRLRIVFGHNVHPAQRQKDRADVAHYAARLAQATGHPISVSEPANFFVVFVGEDERNTVLERLSATIPGLRVRRLAALKALGRDHYCAVLAYGSRPSPTRYGAAIALIRDENPDLLRLSCIHEELAQGLGLANDSPRARPSIFNDNDEFALLTRHDAHLLAMLYDPRLKPGMTEAQARMTVLSLARERLREAP